MAVTVSWHIARVSLTTANLDATTSFYREALGFTQVDAEERKGEAFARLMGLPGARARVAVLRLGMQEVELVAFAAPGRPYPPDSSSADRWFQHMAIVVSDIHAAHAQLATRPGWTPISTSGPQRLPESSGGVTAFKFRDPEGHPLELLEFPSSRMLAMWQGAPGAGPCLGIDHSAIAVASTAASIAFYKGLGFGVSARSLNAGVEQERLDNLPGAKVEVTGLRLAAADPPHLELLCYLPPSAGRAAPSDVHSNDVATTRLILQPRPGQPPSTSSGRAALGNATQTKLVRDPDGHHLVLSYGSTAVGEPAR